MEFYELKEILLCFSYFIFFADISCPFVCMLLFYLIKHFLFRTLQQNTFFLWKKFYIFVFCDIYNYFLFYWLDYLRERRFIVKGYERIKTNRIYFLEYLTHFLRLKLFNSIFLLIFVCIILWLILKLIVKFHYLIYLTIVLMILSAIIVNIFGAW